MSNIDALVRDGSEVGSENFLTLGQVKEWLVGYMQMHEEEMRHFPAEKGRPHWDMLIADFDPRRDAMFVVALFRENDVTLLAGRGPVSAVKDFGDNSFPKDPSRVTEEITLRFQISGRSLVQRDELARWLT